MYRLFAEVIDPPLNLYCYLDQRMYVRTPMTLRITLRNPTRRILHLQAILNNSDGFMFAGHRQVCSSARFTVPLVEFSLICCLNRINRFQLNVTIFSYSSYDLLFNLCPLKAGWQLLPELQLEYQNFQGSSSTTLGATSAPTGQHGTLGAQAVPDGSSTASLVAAALAGDDVITDNSGGLEGQRKAELAALVHRWIPKMVFIHVSLPIVLLLVT